MICQPGDTEDVSRHCGSAVQVTEIAIDDSWTRDSGPVFVVNDRGEVAAVNFGFNSWGGKYLPYDQDAALGTALADVLGTKCYQAPFVLEGGAFYVDGEGTLFTTQGPVLDPARNADASRELFEQVVGEYLGIEAVCGWSLTRIVIPMVILTASPSWCDQQRSCYWCPTSLAIRTIRTGGRTWTCWPVSPTPEAGARALSRSASRPRLERAAKPWMCRT